MASGALAVIGCALVGAVVSGAIWALMRPKPMQGAPDIERCPLDDRTEREFALIEQNYEGGE